MGKAILISWIITVVFYLVLKLICASLNPSERKAAIESDVFPVKCYIGAGLELISFLVSIVLTIAGIVMI